MSKILTPDLCVLGGGPVAAAVAAGAARLGVGCVLVAPDAPPAGQDRLTLAALGAAMAEERAERGGGWPRLRDRAAATLRAAHQGATPGRLRALGVQVVDGPGRFVSPTDVEAAGASLRPRRVVVVPPADRPPALARVLAWDRLPADVAIDGAGPLAVAAAQLLARLGVGVRLAGDPLLAGCDPELAGFVLRRLERDGVALGGVVLAAGGTGGLAVAEPVPGLAGLGLAEAQVAWTAEGGIVADAGGRTSNRRVWAVPFDSPRAPAELAAAVLRGALLRLPARPPPPLAVVFTDPGVAQVGLDEAAARARGVPFRLLRWPLSPTDTPGAGEGLVKAVVDRRGRLLGAGVAARHAALMIAPWSLAVSRRLPATALAATPLPWPSAAEAGRLAAASALAPLLLSGRLGRWARLMLRLG